MDIKSFVIGYQKGKSSAPPTGIEPLVTYDQQNAITDEYFADTANYTTDDYSVSVPYSDQSKYIYRDYGYVKSHPIGHDITFTESGELHLADGDTVYSKAVREGTHTLINCTPNRVAHWWLTVDGNVKRSGTIKPTGQVRMIKTTAANMRDLGGWACDGGTVKYGKLFRCGTIYDTDREVMVGQLGVRHDLDLRSETDNGGITESPLGSDVYYEVTPSTAYYTLSKTSYWQMVLRTIFSASEHNEPLVFHCAQGADRTGTVACIVEALLGVAQTDIDRDYELTTLVFTATNTGGRFRNSANWQKLIGEIGAIASGLSFRDSVVHWVVNSLGFTIDEINEFRRGMIDGNPENIVIGGVYSVTHNLSNVVCSNMATSVAVGSPFNATITANDGYTLSEVVATMGGNVIPVTNGVIAISSVTGDIVITATATETPTEPSTPETNNLADPTSDDWLTGYRLGTSAPSSATDMYVTNYIPCKKGDVLRVKGFNIGYLKDQSSATRAYVCKGDKSIITSNLRPYTDGAFTKVNNTGLYSQYEWEWIVGTTNNSTTYVTNADSIAYARFCGYLPAGGSLDDVIITVNEDIF